MDSSGGVDGGSECASEVEQGQSCIQGEDSKRRCVTYPINAASSLEYLCRTGVHVWRAVEDGAFLF